jgi:hypothetical protein
VLRVTTDPAATGSDTADTVIDTDGHAHRAYDTGRAELVLIRPDGSIAAHRRAGDLSAVLAPAATHGLC